MNHSSFVKVHWITYYFVGGSSFKYGSTRSVKTGRRIGSNTTSRRITHPFSSKCSYVTQLYVVRIDIQWPSYDCSTQIHPSITRRFYSWNPLLMTPQTELTL
eukprot:scaffold50683_cov45-Cyclotella_meneghiniana.AAC.3